MVRMTEGKSKTWDILGMGAVAVDELIYVDGYPAADSKIRIQSRQRSGGGLTATALVAAARLRATVGYFGVLGEDELSRFVITELNRENVDCTAILRWEGATPRYALVIVDRSSGRRCVLSSPENFTEPPPEQISAALISRCRLLFLDHTVVNSGLQAIRVAHALGIAVIADFEKVRHHPAALELLQQVDHLIIPLRLAQELSGEQHPVAAVRTLAKREQACCAVTAGAAGCWYAEHGGEVRHQPALEVCAVDTTGCGDVFHGAYAAAMARREDVARAIKIATITAGLKATRPGGWATIPDLETVSSLMKPIT